MTEHTAGSVGDDGTIAQPWADRHEGTFALDFAAGVELARRHIERTFGEALR